MSLRVKVGSFTKSTAAATASQAVTGVGFQPTALILFSSGGLTSDTWHADIHESVGFCTSGSAGSVSYSGQDGIAGSNDTERAAAKALTIVKYSAVLRAECDLTSFDSDGFTLSWTTNDAIADIIGYIALAGSTLTGAKVIALSGPASTGVTAFTGAGFLPDAVFLAGTHNTAATPTSAAGGGLNFGVAVRGGGQWGVTLGTPIGSSSVSNLERSRLQNRAWQVVGANTSAIAINAEVTSFDSDGFSAHFDNTSANYRAYALCLQGGTWSAPMTAKPTGAATANQLVDHDLTARLILAASNQRPLNLDANEGVGGTGTGGYQGFGASDGTTSVCMAVAVSHPSNAVRVAVTRTDAFFVKCANDTQTEEAVAGTPTFAATQSTVPWTTNDAVAVGVVYLVLGETPTSPTPDTATLSLTGAAPTVVLGTIITPGAGALTLTGAAPAVVQDMPRVPGAGALTLTGAASRLDLGVVPGVGVIVLTQGQAALAGQTIITPGAGALSLTGAAPPTATATFIQPGAGALALLGHAPAVARGTFLTPETGALSLASDPGRVVVTTPGRVPPPEPRWLIDMNVPTAPAPAPADTVPALVFHLETHEGATGTAYKGVTSIGGDRLVASRIDKRIYRSEDDGRTWAAAGDLTAQGIVLSGRLFSPTTDLVIAGGTDGAGLGMYRSEDAGVTWTRTYSNGGGGAGFVDMVSLGATTWLAVGQQTSPACQLLLSGDDGLTWAATGTISGTGAFTRIARLDSGRLLAARDGTGDGFNVYKSDDGGTHWSAAGLLPGTGGLGANHLADLVNMGAGVVLAAGSASAGDVAVWRSADSGDTWTKLADADIAHNPFTGGVMALLRLPGVGQVLLALGAVPVGASGPEWRLSVDSGATFPHVPTAADAPPSGQWFGPVQLALAGDGSVVSADGLTAGDHGELWRGALAAPVFLNWRRVLYSASADPALSGTPDVCGVVASGYGRLLAFRGDYHFLQSLDDGETWFDVSHIDGLAPIATDGTPLRLFSPLADAVFVSGNLADYSAGSLYRSADGGATWAAAYTSPGVYATGYAVCPNGDYLAFGWFDNGAGGYVNTLRSTDAGATWALGVQVDAGQPLPNDLFYYTGKALSDGSMLATRNFGPVLGLGSPESVYVYSSTNNGATWSKIGPLPGGYTVDTTPGVSQPKYVTDILDMGNGVVLLTGAGFDASPFTDALHQPVWLWRSTDYGATWARVTFPV